MKYHAAPTFAADWTRLSHGEQDLFLTKIRSHFIPACDRFAIDPSIPWPTGLRIKRVQGTSGIWEMTWNFAGPDGRATFEWIEVSGALAVRWRRIGGHRIFERP